MEILLTIKQILTTCCIVGVIIGTKKVMSTTWIVFILLFLDLIGTTLDTILANSCLHLFRFCHIFFLTFFTTSFTPPPNSNVLISFFTPSSTPAFTPPPNIYWHNGQFLNIQFFMWCWSISISIVKVILEIFDSAYYFPYGFDLED